MNIFIVGGGGREHAIAWKVAQSDRVTGILAAPGSDAIAQLDKCEVVNISVDDHDELLQAAKDFQADLVIVGPEAPLVAGFTDMCEHAGLRVFGPSKQAAQLEGSKQFAKDIMQKYDIPTARYGTFTDLEAAKAYVTEQGAPIVVKADGLAAGKGVVVAETVAEAHEAIEMMMSSRAFGDAGESVVIEECLIGEELSFMAFVHGELVIPMVTAQDHKRAFDRDQGPNTGGMGAYSPVPQFNDALLKEAEKRVLRPMATAMVKEGMPFTGILYAGLMMTNEGPKVIEFNTRFGDPEAQVVLPRLVTDLVDIMEAIMDGHEIPIVWRDEVCVGVVLASEGYPGSYEKGVEFTIPNLTKVGQQWFHAGTRFKEDATWTNAGGRVLLLSTLGTSFEGALEDTYEILMTREWPGLFYRKDIGHKLLEFRDR
ncbi:phosphoribosylamine--glycine ligase [Paenalkalicoccus suaedae]|uniref:Phosphoribosylamine--glycine ligase n=1 Tax=Paenalkalicoccus suaedae TaxID=2592382 RepID=A0A859FAR1_9BACI|nr:phosphoribosylamine--glycine ligase [Paenalkalicoccus suaedae]QKS70423.1 phosphoribosylamine--glycine ligase [Paenalkalicoccus suaedae]